MVRFPAAAFASAVLVVVTRAIACDPHDVPCLEAEAAAHPEDAGAHLRLGIALMDVAVTGSAGAVERALAQFDAALALRPDDALARVHRGWALVLRARDAPMFEKRGHAQRGFREMDAAVAAAPADPAVRLVRAINAYQVPLLLGRDETARGDFRILLAAADETGGALAPELRRKILFHAGAFALKERRPEAAGLLERASRECADEPCEELVQSMLALARRESTPHSHAHAEEQSQTSPP